MRLRRVMGNGLTEAVSGRAGKGARVRGAYIEMLGLLRSREDSASPGQLSISACSSRILMVFVKLPSLLDIYLLLIA